MDPLQCTFTLINTIGEKDFQSLIVIIISYYQEEDKMGKERPEDISTYLFDNFLDFARALSS